MILKDYSTPQGRDVGFGVVHRVKPTHDTPIAGRGVGEVSLPPDKHTRIDRPTPDRCVLCGKSNNSWGEACIQTLRVGWRQ